MVSTLLSILLGVVVVLLITALAGYFVAQEFGRMAVDRSRLRARAGAGDVGARASVGHHRTHVVHAVRGTARDQPPRIPAPTTPRLVRVRWRTASCGHLCWQGPTCWTISGSSS